MTPPVVPVELGSQGPNKLLSQKPYKYGMAMLCLGALINWLGLAEHYIEPIRFVGIACIITGAMLICAAMCSWMNTHAAAPTAQGTTDIHVIELGTADMNATKPPDYDSVAAAPPSYDAAIKLSPMHLLHEENQRFTAIPTTEVTPPAYTVAAETTRSQ